ncbi:hypothetical protein F2Q69_00028766 [Brassica cretica]|uniref:Uncharacterized protein n=1 Tax=Brassica cretica TaxID=69181 RepID=A0A8S9RTL4_BRACR|nr:hypothetical protein F2Q69_00028766 [Brassica cretica]
MKEPADSHTIRKSTKEVLINTLQASVIDSVNQAPNDTVNPVSNATVYLASNGIVYPASNDTVHPDTVYLDTVHSGIFHSGTVHPITNVIYCRGGQHPRAPDVEHTRAGSCIGTQQEKGWDRPLELCRTLSGSVDGNKGNTPETRGTSNGIHRDVGTARSSEHRKKDDKKGKNAATPNTQIWKKKESASTPKLRIGGNSKSSRESSVLPNQRASSSGHQLSSDKKKASTSSDASQEHLTVFERLGQKENSPIQETGESEKSQEGLSSKGSQSPPSVFERLGSLSASSSEKKRRTSDLHSYKRRRSSNSGDRITNKAWLETREDNMTSPSVFQRLGSQGKGSEGRNSGDKTHSALVAA